MVNGEFISGVHCEINHMSNVYAMCAYICVHCTAFWKVISSAEDS